MFLCHCGPPDFVRSMFLCHCFIDFVRRCFCVTVGPLDCCCKPPRRDERTSESRRFRLLFLRARALLARGAHLANEQVPHAAPKRQGCSAAFSRSEKIDQLATGLRRMTADGGCCNYIVILHTC